MNEKLKIKVIKKDEIKAPAPSVKIQNRTKREAARDVVSTVSNWVTDFQIRKRDETKAAIEKFLTPNPRPSES